VTGLEEEVERTKLWIPCAGPAACNVREAGAGESRDRARGGGGAEQGGAPPHQGPVGQATAGMATLFSSDFGRQVLTNELTESTLGGTSTGSGCFTNLPQLSPLSGVPVGGTLHCTRIGYNTINKC
jgi:hypothetical protein